MRIAYLSDSTIPSRKANGIQVMNMCQAFAAAGHDVTLFAKPGETIANDFDFYGVSPTFQIIKSKASGTRRIREWVYANRTLKQLKCEQPFDLVYGRHLPSLARIAVGNVPFIYEAHQPASFLGRQIERRLFRRPNLAEVVFISESLRSHYRTVFPELNDLKTVVAHDSGVSKNISLSRNQSAVSKRLAVGYSGSLYPGRGIEIICALAQRLPDVSFHICGGSPEEIKRYSTLATSCQNLEFHGFLPPSEISEWQRSMDILLAPYQLDGPIIRWTSPLKIFEYMASGRPIVSSDVPVLREVLTHEVNALLIPPENVSAWASAVQRLSDDRLRKLLAKNAADELRSKYTWEKRVSQVLGTAPMRAEAS